ncbi:MAG TPA: DEAD/DEAH box helicase [Magnetospirillaceae bacterium]|nr:DEAD/DEAH box helicase [Magnetospirillaceae bacterium]
MESHPAIQVFDRILSGPDIAPGIAWVERIAPAEGSYAPLPPGLDGRLADALSRKGIVSLYTHQRAAWDLARAGRSFVVVTPTASGKTLCYNLPVVQTLLEDSSARALYIFPTKALSQDQQAALNEVSLGGCLPLRIATYDGDTPASVRVSARDTGRIVITNPDMLHSGILPNHAKWVRFFSGLRYVVVDEMHGYRGIFGSHVANVIRRLRRVAAFYGARPSFILCSATIGNPVDLAERLVEEPVAAITENGSPRAAKLVVLYNPPSVDPVQGIRRSSTTESQKLAVSLLREGIRTILFARSRLRVELIAAYINRELRNIYTDNAGIVVEPYRSGLLPTERRAIERGLREGTVHGVVSTNALELGIDIGGLDAAIVVGFPGSFASFWQQAGRAGRRQGLSAAFFVASSNPLDQYIVAHPEYFFGASAETGRVDPANPYVYMDHVKCAAFELPFEDGEIFGPDAGEALSFLSEEGIVRKAGGRWYWSSAGYPSEAVSLRSASSDNVVIVDSTGGRNKVIGEMDRPSAKELIYDDAVYIHRGRQYIVLKLDLENRLCRVEESEVNYYTDAVVKTDIKVLTEDSRGDSGGAAWVLTDILVRSEAEKFKKLSFHTHENVGYGDIHLPPEEMQTRSLAVLFPEDRPPGAELAAGGPAFSAAVLAGVSGLVRRIAPAFLMCDPRDIGAAERVRDDHFRLPCLYLYDQYPGGTGLAEALAELLPSVFRGALEAAKRCPCLSGCPSCIGAAFEDERYVLRGDVKVAVIRFLSAMTG